MLTTAGEIVSRMKRTPRSSLAYLLRRFRRYLNDEVKEEVREGLYRMISTALEEGGIPPGVIDAMTTVFVNILIEGIELVYSRVGENIVLHLWCASLESLLTLRQTTMSGLLLRVVTDTMKQLVQSRSRVYLLTYAEDYRPALFALKCAGGTPIIIVIIQHL